MDFNKRPMALGLLAALLLSIQFSASTSFALPLPRQALLSVPEPVGDLRVVDFSAIIALSNCSGSLVRFESSLGSDAALLLTNGHCIGGSGFLKPGEVRVNVPVSRKVNLLKPDGKSVLGSLTADRILYATMTNTDVALYRLQKTYDQIAQEFGTQALTLSAQHPQAGRTIVVASGYWRRMYRCSIDRFIYQLHEAGWIFADSIRYSQPGCETIGGTSGSPIIDEATHQVVGINNTGNENGGNCTMNNPCEVTPNGTRTVSKGASYGQQTFWFYSCLNVKAELDLNIPGCQLPKPQATQRRI